MGCALWAEPDCVSWPPSHLGAASVLDTHSLPLCCRFPGLQELSKRVQKDLQYLAYPARAWVPARKHPRTQQHVYDVLVVGGGQCGLTTAFGLIKEQVRVHWGLRYRTFAADVGHLNSGYAPRSATGHWRVLAWAMLNRQFLHTHTHTEGCGMLPACCRALHGKCNTFMLATLCTGWCVHGMLQVTNVCVLDENPEGLEGPWVTYARMWTLRTNKALTGTRTASMPCHVCCALWGSPCTLIGAAASTACATTSCQMHAATSPEQRNKHAVTTVLAHCFRCVDGCSALHRA